MAIVMSLYEKLYPVKPDKNRDLYVGFNRVV